MPLQPGSYIVPLFTAGDERIFLGTAFFVETEESFLLTAHHCIENFGTEFVISITQDDTVSGDVMPWSNVKLYKTFRQFDLAVLKSTDYDPPYTVKIPDSDEIHLNELVVCHEFSDTRIVGAKRYATSAATRVGNITRMLDRTDILGDAGQNVLELSFAALKGSSGAPVITRKSMVLRGMILQNVQHHLLPAHIEKIVDDAGNVSEETQFMLPQALALNVRHIRKALESFHIIP